MTNKGMSKETYNHILEHRGKLKNINTDAGIITTSKGNHGTVCTSTGYLRVKLGGKTLQVHQIIAVSLFGRDCIGLQVNHKNGIKTDNRSNNLEVVTRTQNIKHQWENGLASNNGGMLRKLDASGVDEIRAKHVFGKRKGKYSTKYFREKYGVSATAILDVVHHRSYV